MGCTTLVICTNTVCYPVPYTTGTMYHPYDVPNNTIYRQYYIPPVLYTTSTSYHQYFVPPVSYATVQSFSYPHTNELPLYHVLSTESQNLATCQVNRPFHQTDKRPAKLNSPTSPGEHEISRRQPTDTAFWISVCRFRHCAGSP